MLKFYRYLTILIILVCILVGFKQEKKSRSQTKNEKVVHRIDSIINSYHKNGFFNGVLLVAKKNEVIFKKGFGYSNINKASLSHNHKFNIGSIYKEIPAIAIMQLEEKRLLTLEDSLHKFLPELPAWSKQITVKNLLQYTGGLPKVSWSKYKEISDESLMNDLLELKELKFKPGEDYLYTNYSPFLLSKIVEKVTKNNFKKYVDENLLKPFNLSESVFKTSFPYQDKKDMAIPFNQDFKEDAPPFKIKSPSFLFSSTAIDLSKFLKELHSYTIISKKSLLTLSKTADFKSYNMQSSLGNVKVLNDNIVSHLHHGSSGNYECLISQNNEKDITIIVLTNRNNKNVFEIKNKIEKTL